MSHTNLDELRDRLRRLEMNYEQADPSRFMCAPSPRDETEMAAISKRISTVLEQIDAINQNPGAAFQRYVEGATGVDV